MQRQNHNNSTRIRVIACSVAFSLVGLATVQAAPSTSQTFELQFTLTDIIDVSTGQSIDPSLLSDVQIFGQPLPNPPTINNDGNGTATHGRTEFFNGSPLGTFDGFQLEIGDTFSTVQTNDTSVPSGEGQGQIFEFFSWDISVDNSTFEDLQFVFDWAYTRDIDLVEMGTGDSATVFLDRGTVFVENFEGFEDDFELFPDPFVSGNNPLNIGTLPPGTDLTLTDDGTFTLDVHGVDSDSSAILFEWEIGARSTAIVPEPSSCVMLFLAVVCGPYRRLSCLS